MFQEIQENLYLYSLKMTTYLRNKLNSIEGEFRISESYFLDSEGFFEEEIFGLPLIADYAVVSIDQDLMITGLSVQDHTSGTFHFSEIPLTSMLEICQYIENNF